MSDHFSDDELKEQEEQMAKLSKNGKPLGGARPGSGRKPGTSTKISAMVILDEFERQTNKRFEEVLVEEFIKAQESDDTRLVKEYLQFIANKVIADKIETDVTSNGETITQPIINLIKGPSTL